MIDLDLIHKLVSEAGFSLCGVARCRKLSEQSKPLHDWLSADHATGLHYMKRNTEKRLDPTKLVLGAKTIIVCGANYKNSAWNQSLEGRFPKISSYAYSRDYHKTLKEMLFDVLGKIKAKHPQVEGRCFVDTAPLLEKAWASEAGLGWRGKNSLLITPEYGSFLFLGEIIINLEATSYNQPYAKEQCGNCTLCIDSCPTGAINHNKTIDTRLCISRLTVEQMPDELKTDPAILNGWLFGCDECQSCCPYNKKTPLYTLPQFKPVIDPSQTTSEFWRTLSEEKFNTLFGDTPMSRGGYNKLRERIDFLLNATSSTSPSHKKCE